MRYELQVNSDGISPKDKIKKLLIFDKRQQKNYNKYHCFTLPSQHNVCAKYHHSFSRPSRTFSSDQTTNAIVPWKEASKKEWTFHYQRLRN